MPRLKLDKHAVFADLGYKPHEGQRLVHESTAPRRVVCCGVRWGKSLCAAMEALAASLEPKERSMGWVVAPTYDLSDKVWRELVYLMATHLRHRIVTIKEHEKRLIVVNMGGGRSEIRAKSADNPTSLLGEALDWVVLDECARLKASIWESFISQRLIDRKGWALMISTPKGRGWLYDAYRRGQGDDTAYESWNAPSWQNPHLDTALIEEERERIPGRVFQQEYGGQFVEGSGAVFRGVRDCATGEFQEPVKGKIYYGGVDLAKHEDYSVVVIVNRKREVVFLDRFHRVDWSLQIQRIRAASDRFNRAELLVDATGIGDPIFEALRKEGLRVQPYTLTNRSKAALIDNLSMMIERKQITLPRPELAPEMIEELEAFEYSITDSGNVRTSAPGGQHDDCVIGLGLAAWSVRPTRPIPGIFLI